MSSLVRRVDQDEAGTVMILGGEHGVVTLHASAGLPDSMTLHSPRAVPGGLWTGPSRCRWMELPCWSLSSVTGEDLRAALARAGRGLSDAALWSLMEDDYWLYLEDDGER